MDQLLMILNSPFGLLVAGALITGLLVQYIATKWQQKNWIFQQSFTTSRAKFEKELEQRYEALESINQLVSEILMHSQLVVVGYSKHVPPKQGNEQMLRYNDEVREWMVQHQIWKIRLKTFFTDQKLPALWDAISDKRDELDKAIYRLTSNKQGTPQDSLTLIEQISDMTVDLSQRMFDEIENMTGFG